MPRLPAVGDLQCAGIPQSQVLPEQAVEVDDCLHLVAVAEHFVHCLFECVWTLQLEDCRSWNTLWGRSIRS